MRPSLFVSCASPLRLESTCICDARYSTNSAKRGSLGRFLKGGRGVHMPVMGNRTGEGSYAKGLAYRTVHCSGRSCLGSSFLRSCLRWPKTVGAQAFSRHAIPCTSNSSRRRLRDLERTQLYSVRSVTFEVIALWPPAMAWLLSTKLYRSTLNLFPLLLSPSQPFL